MLDHTGAHLHFADFFGVYVEVSCCWPIKLPINIKPVLIVNVTWASRVQLSAYTKVIGSGHAVDQLIHYLVFRLSMSHCWIQKVTSRVRTLMDKPPTSLLIMTPIPGIQRACKLLHHLSWWWVGGGGRGREGGADNWVFEKVWVIIIMTLFKEEAQMDKSNLPCGPLSTCPNIQ